MRRLRRGRLARTRSPLINHERENIMSKQKPTPTNGDATTTTAAPEPSAPPPATHNSQGLKTGVFVDVYNIAMCGGYGMRYDVVQDFAARNNAQLLRLNAYGSYDPNKPEQKSFHYALRRQGYKVVAKEVRRYTDSQGMEHTKSNVDVELTVDMLMQADYLDRIVLFTGDGDFVHVVRAIQNKGCRVEVVAFDNVSAALRREADMFVSGYLIPNLLPINRQDYDAKWGDVTSYVRGTVLSYFRDTQHGFFTYMRAIDGDMWRHPKDERSVYDTIYFSDSDLAAAGADSHNINRYVAEFRIAHGNNKNQLKAEDVRLFPASY